MIEWSTRGGGSPRACICPATSPGTDLEEIWHDADADGSMIVTIGGATGSPYDLGHQALPLIVESMQQLKLVGLSATRSPVARLADERQVDSPGVPGERRMVRAKCSSIRGIERPRWCRGGEDGGLAGWGDRRADTAEPGQTRDKQGWVSSSGRLPSAHWSKRVPGVTDGVRRADAELTAANGRQGSPIAACPWQSGKTALARQISAAAAAHAFQK
ncbi:uncharacterized protein BJ171DRAFT_477242 [Polychytrium aggregatum]|uniref:uncharacterized protein n=1 Tax=Polychytrium aggregatum TaxID=110093 RepID=UPI0022FE7819|nr:uncharacterized protein BJ171DRAFT_477242 [Polychytrium aggregatum]KAI9199793.1 hypothetical protein BJ171DRAFT_477242 [Polychytrium aggregatum]